MQKWYESNEVDNDIVLSSRIRLARNVDKYSFPIKMTAASAEEMIRDISGSVLTGESEGSSFEMIDLAQMQELDKNIMVEQHLVSPDLAKSSLPSALLIKTDENISVMLSEEDHIRIQAFAPGDKIDDAFNLANETDDCIESKVNYAFDKDLGYLTSCPTNLGTGLRASFMLHLPYLEINKQIPQISQAVGKFGMTIRGTYGEGTEPVASIYQISNQVTLGLSETEIINNLKTITVQIIEKEKELAKRAMKNHLLVEDQVYRSYGLLSNARILTDKEAFKHLSILRFGYMENILKEPKPKMTIYKLIMNIHNASLSKKYNTTDLKELLTARASYIRDQLK